MIPHLAYKKVREWLWSEDGEAWATKVINQALAAATEQITAYVTESVGGSVHKAIQGYFARVKRSQNEALEEYAGKMAEAQANGEEIDPLQLAQAQMLQNAMGAAQDFDGIKQIGMQLLLQRLLGGVVPAGKQPAGGSYSPGI